MNRKFSKEERKNIQDLTALLKMLMFKKVIGHYITPDFKTIFIHLEDFDLEIDIENASWKRNEMSVFVSPIIERIPWDK